MTAPVLDPAESSADAADPAEQAAHGWPVPSDEDGRVAALHAFGVLDQPRQADLDAAARLAAYVCGTPAAVVNLIDSDRQWQAAAYGTEPGEVSRADAMCQHTVLGTEVVYTPDASTEALFADNPFVTGRVASVRLYASAPLLTRSGYAVGTICAYADRPGELDAVQLELLRDIAAQVVALFETRRVAAALARAASRDQLTGLANRRTLETAISHAIARAERGLGTPSVVAVDLDGFKAVNDQLGHAAGDAVLRSVAQRLLDTSREVDTVGRIGGDEFVVLLEHTGGPGAQAALRRLRSGLDGLRPEGDGTDGAVGAVTASLGMTTYRPGDGVATLLARADAEMYADKSRRAAAG
jgi:diguanylate cyclase (GGDEF)-like protein